VDYKLQLLNRLPGHKDRNERFIIRRKILLERVEQVLRQHFIEDSALGSDWRQHPRKVAQIRNQMRSFISAEYAIGILCVYRRSWTGK